MRSTRRNFLKSSFGVSAVLGLGAAVPAFLREAAAADAKATGDTVLVMVQLTGGNDGLNTVIPYADDVYHRNRPKLAIPTGQVLKVDDALGFHPELSGLHKLFDRGELAVVHGVGYADPNRSHFESMDIWHTCHRKQNRRDSGWLGRYLDASVEGDGGDVPAMHLGHENQPLALAARRIRVPSVTSLDRFRLQLADAALEKTVGALSTAPRESNNDLLDFVESSTTSALAASRRVETARGDYNAKATYPDTALAAKFRTIAQLIHAGMATRVYYVTLDGFDTHAKQAESHAALLSELSGGIQAFIEDVGKQGHGDRVLVACFSEFGRRVAENASAGTDHGAAAPLFLAGRKVRAGMIGVQPSLTDLSDGDLKFAIDFRQVYAALLENWLGWPSAPILGETWTPADILAT